MSRKVRCGFCLDGRHRTCVINIEMGTKKDGGKYLYECPCECNTSDRHRCVDCNRRENQIEIQNGRCVDRDGCKGYRAARRSKDPVFQMLDEIKERRESASASAPTATPRKTPVTRECICCGEPTRGGKFLPGHDSRYVSLMAKEATASPDSVSRLREHLAGISGALCVKFDKATS